MNDLNIDEAETERVAAQLETAANSTLVPELTRLQTEVNLLLEDGLLLTRTSEKLKTTYAEFNTNVTAAVNNIPMFSDQFRKIVAAVNGLDADIYAKLDGYVEAAVPTHDAQ